MEEVSPKIQPVFFGHCIVRMYNDLIFEIHLVKSGKTRGVNQNKLNCFKVTRILGGLLPRKRSFRVNFTRLDFRFTRLSPDYVCRYQ